MAAGIVIAGVATIGALAQTSGRGDSELRLRRSTLLDDNRTRARRDERPVGEVPQFGFPPGAGAGKTGFRSARTIDRRGARARTGTSRIPPAPLSLIPPGAASGAGAPMAQHLAQVAATPVRARGASGPVRDVASDPTRPVLPPRRRPPAQDDPFEPVGFHVGSFLLRPAIEAVGGYDSNPARTPGGKGSWFGIAGGELQVRSEWQRHDFRADIRGNYTTFESQSSLDRPFLDARAKARIDVIDQTKLELDGRYVVSTDNPGSPDLPADLAKLPIFTNSGATAGLVQSFNRFEMALKATYDHFDYQRSKLADGTTVSNADRNYDQYGGLVRASYELFPGVRPFAEVYVDHRSHELEFDRFGQQRDSDGAAFKVGGVFDLARTLTGEAAIGYLTRRYDDPSLEDVRGMLADAALIWSASALTTVTLKAATTADESTLPGVSGVLRRDASVQLDHAWRRWLVSTLKFNYGTDDYHGSPREDDRYTASAVLTYKLSRFAEIKGEFRREWLRSNDPGNDYEVNIGLIGMRWQP